MSGVSERKSAAPCCWISKLHVAGTVPGEGMVAELTVGTPATEVIVIGMFGFGSGDCGTRTKVAVGHAIAITVREVTEIVLPRVHVGNFDAEICSVST